MADVEITVRGSHHSKAAPERAKVRLRVARDGGDVEQVVGDVTRLAEQVRNSVTALHDADAGPVVAWSSDRMQTWSSRPWNQDGEQLPLVHHGQIGFDVEFADFTVLGRWLSQTATVDGIAVDAVEWTLTDAHRDELSAEVRAGAVVDARAKAEVYARALGLTRVTVLAVADAGMLGLQPVGGGGHEPVPIARMRAMSAAAPDVELAPHPISVTAEVDARFLAS
jgi:uncharacterized protein